MPETLAYPEPGEDADMGSDCGSTTGTSRWQLVVGILGLSVALWVGGEMYDVMFFSGPGFGPDPGQDAPVEIQDPDGVPTPSSGSVPHDPTQFDH